MGKDQTDVPKLELWGRGTSTNVQKAIWICHELGLTPDRHQVGGPYGGLKTRAYRQLNPHRKVPVLVDGETVIWESHTILRYISKRFGDGVFYGTTAAAQAEVEMWLDWFATSYWPAIRFLFLSVFQNKTRSFETPTAQDHVSCLNENLALISGELQKKGFLARAEFTLADIALAISLNRLEGLKLPITLLAPVQSYFKRMKLREAYAIATADDPTK